jgi:hypothetical protein
VDVEKKHRLGPLVPDREPLRARLAARSRQALAGVLAFAAALFAPAPVVIALLLGSGGCAVAGVYVLAGYGWSLIAGSAALLLLAAALARGMANA